MKQRAFGLVTKACFYILITRQICVERMKNLRDYVPTTGVITTALTKYLKLPHLVFIHVHNRKAFSSKL